MQASPLFYLGNYRVIEINFDLNEVSSSSFFSVLNILNSNMNLKLEGSIYVTSRIYQFY